MARTDKRARQEFAGIPDSKPFIAPEGAFTRESTLPDGLEYDELTVAGMALKDMPIEAQGRILFQQTDQGAAWWERNRHKLENRDTIPPIERGMGLATGGEATDAADKIALQYRDDLVAGVPLEAAMARAGIPHTGRLVQRRDADPFAMIMEQHVPAGYSGLMMSKKQIDKKGMIRGAVEYVPVFDKEGNKVTSGDFCLAMAPTEVVDAAKRMYAEDNLTQQNRAVERVREEQDRIITDGRLGKVARRNRAGDDFEGIVEDDHPGDFVTDSGTVFAG